MKSVLMAFAISLTLPCLAQFFETQQDMVLSRRIRAQLIDSIVSKIHNRYIFPDKAAVIEKAVRKFEKEHNLADISSSILFTEQMNQLLMQVSNDKHLRTLYSHKKLPHQDSKDGPLPQFITQFAVEHNYGFVKQEILQNNIGYINILGFFPFEEAYRAATSAFSFVENTAALIVDLRQNSGGESKMNNFVISYFFDQKPVNFLSNHFRKDGRVEQAWSASDVPGSRYLNRPVFILTSHQTFSAGEAMAFVLQSFKKATVVGEVTGGGGNICDPARLSDHFMINLPVGYPVVPGTEKNWDGIGVIPDIQCSSDKALDVALSAAMKLLSDSSRPVFVPHTPTSTIPGVSP